MTTTHVTGRMTTRLRTIIGVTALAVAGAVGLAQPAAAAVPVAPSGLTATYLTNQGSVQLAWTDNSADETGFQLERCITLACPTFTPIITLPAGTVAFTDLSSTGGTTQYRVRAVNASGVSAYSAVASVFLLSTGETPTAVLTATPSAGYAPLAVTVDGTGSFGFGGPVTSWTWDFGDGGSATGATASHVYTAPGTYVAVLTVRGGGFGFGRQWVPIVVSQKLLTAPSDLAATSPARARAALTWSNPVSTATSIVVERCSGSGCTGFRPVATLAPTVTTWIDTTVRSRTRYGYRLRVTDGTPATAVSNVASVLTR